MLVTNKARKQASILLEYKHLTKQENQEQTVSVLVMKKAREEERICEIRDTKILKKHELRLLARRKGNEPRKQTAKCF